MGGELSVGFVLPIMALPIVVLPIVALSIVALSIVALSVGASRLRSWGPGGGGERRSDSSTFSVRSLARCFPSQCTPFAQLSSVLRKGVRSHQRSMRDSHSSHHCSNGGGRAKRMERDKIGNMHKVECDKREREGRESEG